jgi:hypothetical protein
VLEICRLRCRDHESNAICQLTVDRSGRLVSGHLPPIEFRCACDMALLGGDTCPCVRFVTLYRRWKANRPSTELPQPRIFEVLRRCLAGLRLLRRLRPSRLPVVLSFAAGKPSMADAAVKALRHWLPVNYGTHSLTAMGARLRLATRPPPAQLVTRQFSHETQLTIPEIGSSYCLRFEDVSGVDHSIQAALAGRHGDLTARVNFNSALGLAEFHWANILWSNWSNSAQLVDCNTVGRAVEKFNGMLEKLECEHWGQAVNHSVQELGSVDVGPSQLTINLVSHLLHIDLADTRRFVLLLSRFLKGVDELESRRPCVAPV